MYLLNALPSSILSGQDKCTHFVSQVWRTLLRMSALSLRLEFSYSSTGAERCLSSCSLLLESTQKTHHYQVILRYGRSQQGNLNPNCVDIKLCSSHIVFMFVFFSRNILLSTWHCCCVIPQYFCPGWTLFSKLSASHSGAKWISVCTLTSTAYVATN